MTEFCERSDPAAEQLYDELMTRTWALHGVLQSVTTDVTRAEVSTRLAAAALSHVRDLRGSIVHAGVLHALLWPTGSCPGVGDAWWATPLGQFLSAGQRADVAVGPATEREPTSATCRGIDSSVTRRRTVWLSPKARDVTGRGSALDSP